MIRASVQHTLNFRNLAFQNFYFMVAQVYVCERNLHIAFQCFQKLPEPHQIDTDGRFDHAATIFSHRLAKCGCPLTNASERFLLWKTGAETRPEETLHQWCVQVPDSGDCPDNGRELRAAPSGVMRGLDPRIHNSRPCAGHPRLETRKVWVQARPTQPSKHSMEKVHAGRDHPSTDAQRAISIATSRCRTTWCRRGARERSARMSSCIFFRYQARLHDAGCVRRRQQDDARIFYGARTRHSQ